VPAVLVHEPWRAVRGLRHGFLAGRVEPHLRVLCPRQVHGTRVVTAEPDGERVEADGLVTGSSGVAIGVVTADCVPILLLAPGRRVAAAVHAGWRGTTTGIVDSALAHLSRAFGVEPDDVEATLGPAIGACCYEVGPEVRDAFTTTSGHTTAPAWREADTTPVGDRLMLDLRRAVELLLRRAGVRTIATIGPCTRCAPDYCSYRRDGAGCGRQLSFIGWA
jgi:YfiH family protein